MPVGTQAKLLRVLEHKLRRSAASRNSVDDAISATTASDDAERAESCARIFITAQRVHIICRRLRGIKKYPRVGEEPARGHEPEADRKVADVSEAVLNISGLLLAGHVRGVAHTLDAGRLRSGLVETSICAGFGQKVRPG